MALAFSRHFFQIQVLQDVIHVTCVDCSVDEQFEFLTDVEIPEIILIKSGENWQLLLELVISETNKAEIEVFGSEILEEVLVELFEKGRKALFFRSEEPAVSEDDLLLDIVGGPVHLVGDRQLLDVVFQLFRDRQVRRLRTHRLRLCVQLFYEQRN